MARSWASRRVGKNGERVLVLSFMEVGVMMGVTGVVVAFSVGLRRVDIEKDFWGWVRWEFFVIKAWVDVEVRMLGSGLLDTFRLFRSDDVGRRSLCGGVAVRGWCLARFGP